MLQTSEPASATPELTPSLKAANYDGMAWAVMVGSGENFINVFGIFLRATPMQLGILTTLPQFLGAFSQMVAVWALKFMRSRRAAIIKCGLINACVWLPIAVLPFVFGVDSQTVWILLGLVIVYHASGNFSNPLWSSLIGELVPAKSRGRYFGRRNRLIGFCTFMAVLCAGQVLDLTKRFGDTRYGFLAIFIIAALGRFITLYFLRRYDDPPHESRHEHHFSFWQFLVRSPRSNFARFVFYVSLVNFAVNISAPFFSLYMLSELHWSYWLFTIITTTNTATQFLTMQYWGKISDQFGNKKILNICGYGVGLTPIMWIISANVYYLFFAQVFAGFVWAGFNLAAANFIYDAVTPPKRARCVAYQAMVNGALVLAGSFLGGLMVPHLPHDVAFGIWTWVPSSPLFFIFLLSGLLRLFTAMLFLPLFREVREVQGIKHTELIFRITNLRPMAGATFSIMTGRGRPRRRG